MAVVFGITHSQSNECFKGDEQVNGKSQNSTPRHAKTLLPILTKFGTGDKVVDLTRDAKFYRAPFRGFCSPYT